MSDGEQDRFPENLRRLLYFHHRSAKEAAQSLGVSEHAVSAWLTGKRRPSGSHMLKIALRYHFDLTILAEGDLVEFASELARPERIEFVLRDEKTRRLPWMRHKERLAPLGEDEEVEKADVSAKATADPEEADG